MSWIHEITVQITLFISFVSLVATIPWILMTKKESTSAVAWCLLVFFLPLVGALFFVLFGYQHVNVSLKRKRRHKKRFKIADENASRSGGADSMDQPEPDCSVEGLARLADRFGAFPMSRANEVVLYHEGQPAFAALFEAIAAAKHHIHLEYFIVQPDGIGRELSALLQEQARKGVEVRLLYDAMGSRRLHRWHLYPLRKAGVKVSTFLPVSILRRRIQVNLRDHRKIAVIDGAVAFTGGLNIGDEYLGKVPRFGFWRDTHLQVRGPAVTSLQRIFVEDWDFAAQEDLRGSAYFPRVAASGSTAMQVIHSGPDQDFKSIREMYFAATLHARKRLWIASPYFVPDAGLRDALCLAAYTGVDVRLLCQYHPDKWIPWFAGRYYFDDVLNAGMQVYQYTKGMMHSKVMIVDGAWASVGSANLDNRSLHLNFEVNCFIYTKEVVEDLERAFLNDLQASIRLERRVFSRRPLASKMVENACRLLSPVL